MANGNGGYGGGYGFRQDFGGQMGGNQAFDRAFGTNMGVQGNYGPMGVGNDPNVMGNSQTGGGDPNLGPGPVPPWTPPSEAPGTVGAKGQATTGAGYGPVPPGLGGDYRGGFTPQFPPGGIRPGMWPPQGNPELPPWVTPGAPGQMGVKGQATTNGMFNPYAGFLGRR